MKSNKKMVEILTKLEKDNNLKNALDNADDFALGEEYLTNLRNRQLFAKFERESGYGFNEYEYKLLYDIVFTMNLNVTNNAKVQKIESVANGIENNYIHFDRWSKERIDEKMQKIDLKDISFKKFSLSLLYYLNIFEDIGKTEKDLSAVFPSHLISPMKNKVKKYIRNHFTEEEKKDIIALIASKDSDDRGRDNQYSLYIANYKKELADSPKPDNNIRLSEISTQLMSDYIYSPYDLLVMTNSRDVGLKMVAMYNEVDKDVADADKDKEVVPIAENYYLFSMDPKKFYQVSLHRVLNILENKKDIKNTYGLVNACIETKHELDRLNSRNAKNNDKVLIVESIKDSEVEYKELNDEVINKEYEEAMNKMFERYLIDAENEYDILRKNKKNKELDNDVAYLNTDELKLNKEIIKNVISNIENPEDFLYIAYKKRKFISASEMAEICMDDGLSITPIITKMIMNMKHKADNDQDYLSNEDFARFIKGTIEKGNVGYLPNLLKVLYENGNVTADDINMLKEYVDKHEIEEYCNIDMMKSDTKDLVYLYKKLNKEKIAEILKKKEKFTDEEIKEYMSIDPAFNEDIDREKKIELQALYKYQKDMFVAKKAYRDPKELDILIDELGELGFSSAIVIDLFKEGLIDKEAGLQLDSNFMKYYNAYTVKKFSKGAVGDYKDIGRFLNAYSHDQISLKDIVKGYAKDEVPEEFYDVIKKDIDSKIIKEKCNPEEIFDKGFLKELYNEATKRDAKREFATYLGKYWKECIKYLDENQKSDFYQEIKQKELKEIEEGRISSKALIKLGEIKLLDNDVLGKIVDKKKYNVIEDLIQKNVLGFDKAKYLFEDQYSKTNQSYVRRDLLEKIFKESNLSNEDKMNILYTTYAIEPGMSLEQKDLNNNNFVYFLEKGLVRSIENYVYEKIEKEQRAASSGPVLGKPEQQKFPLLERIGKISEIDDSMNVFAKNNGFIFKSPNYGKVIIESIGKKGKGGIIQNDITNHRTYIMSEESFNKIENQIFEKDSDGRQIIFEDVIRVIREREINDGTWVNHTGEQDTWVERIAKKVKGANKRFKSKEKDLNKEKGKDERK